MEEESCGESSQESKHGCDAGTRQDVSEKFTFSDSESPSKNCKDEKENSELECGSNDVSQDLRNGHENIGSQKSKQLKETRDKTGVKRKRSDCASSHEVWKKWVYKNIINTHH